MPPMKYIKFLSVFYKKILDGVKIHTIRKSTDLKPGDRVNFHFNYDDIFIRGIHILHIQEIIIEPVKRFVYIKDKGIFECTKMEVQCLARNSGFDDVDKFFGFFTDVDKDGKPIDNEFKGVIIHWKLEKGYL